MTRMSSEKEHQRQLLESTQAMHARIRKLVEVLSCKVPLTDSVMRDLRDIQESSQKAQKYVNEVLDKKSAP